MLVPLSYNLRSLFVRKSATLLTVLGVGAVVAIVSGTLALQQGFHHMFTTGGRDDVAVFLRPGATNEGDSQFSRDRGLKLIKSVPEIEIGPNGPLAGMEAYLALLLAPKRGGVTNVPLRGVQPVTFEIRAKEVRISEGRNFTPGHDELVVGARLVDRIENCRIGDVLTLNKTPFKVVGILDHDGQFGGEIWGDLDRLLAAMGRYGPNRVIAQLKPGIELGSPDPAKALFSDEPVEPDEGTVAARLLKDTEVPAKVCTESQYLSSQTVMLSGMLVFIGGGLGFIMGLAAIFTAMNTMLASVAARTREIGILLSIGYRPFPIFLSFLFEALVLGLIGGLVGCVLTLPFNGVSAGAMNFQTFTEMAFAFRVGPMVLLVAIGFSIALGLIGGALPAWRAARLRPTAALRRE
ncbi:MAG: ABC transporter permease [Planctomycetes bacterium]|nr:ABC transporter permease [Planctomycetota bacterium]